MSTFTTRDDSGVMIVAFTESSGLNDFRNTPVRDSLFELVQDRAAPLAALDMAKVDYLSSSGVAILVGFKRKVEIQGGRLAFFRVQPAVHDLLRVMKLDRYFDIADDEAEALSRLRSAPSV